MSHPYANLFGPMFYLFIAYLIFKFAFQLVLMFCYPVTEKFCKEKKEYSKTQRSYTVEIDKIKAAGLETYDMYQNETYKDLVEAVIRLTHDVALRKVSPSKTKIVPAALINDDDGPGLLGKIKKDKKDS